MRRMNRFGIACLVLMMLACCCLPLMAGGVIGLSLPALSWRAVTLPEPTGPYAVGRVRYDWTDESRMETLCDSLCGKRQLPVFIWYPAEVQPGEVPAEYMPAAWARARQRDDGFFYWLKQDDTRVKAHAVQDAPLAKGQARWPLLVMMPGFGPIAIDYTVLAEDLASRGYVVVGLTPPYNAPVTVFQDGRVVTRSTKGNIPDSASREQAKVLLDHLVSIWSQDASFALDQMTRLNDQDPSGRFTGRLDLERAGIFGHSLGGATAAQACTEDPRFKACANLDGSLYGNAFQKGIQQPFLVLWSQPRNPYDPNIAQDRSDFTSLASRSSNASQETMLGMRHFNFTDYAVLYNPVGHLMGLLGAVDGREGLAQVRQRLGDFFGQYLQ